MGTAGAGSPPEGVEEGRLARLTVTVCMLPRKRANKRALKRRKEVRFWFYCCGCLCVWGRGQ